MSRREEVEFGPSEESVRHARAFVAATLAAWDLDDLAEVAVLLTSELATNAVVHARTACTITVEHRPPDLVIEVSDGEASAPVCQDPNPASEGGRGMLLVDRLANRWGTHSRSAGKSVWFSLRSAG